MHRFASVLLVDHRGWLLLQERDEHPVIDPERWGLVGGHVEDGEEYEAAAYRELAEETGVRLPPGALRLWREVEVFHDAYGTLDATQVWVAAVDLTDADIVVGEGRQIVFVEPEVARQLERTAAATTIVPDFLDSEDYRRLTDEHA
ncbi:NUDIX domain-containing protein [Nocardioides sp. MAH-18]|uniref:NUDIX domain-containing protein n=1 Tax=Nocardioides agri TaxID=2682843 RepID=A0A6L6XX36_9ACTN|nr:MULTISPECIES: NUDIX domain-containing protein [unclassified Nocardioides]MBA2952466.1 NUDIX domain-containing protein [Nocardioides sp. CGMCC 1.13656]MVQ51628.1 NUDIX domain-containing protein [Nocardioides sp. MAH-18]